MKAEFDGFDGCKQNYTGIARGLQNLNILTERAPVSWAAPNRAAGFMSQRTPCIQWMGGIADRAGLFQESQSFDPDVGAFGEFWVGWWSRGGWTRSV